MSKHDADFWNDAVAARNELADRHTGNPEVSYIDIGYPPGDGDREISLRVHVSGEGCDADSGSLSGPQQSVNGIPVHTVRE